MHMRRLAVVFAALVLSLAFAASAGAARYIVVLAPGVDAPAAADAQAARYGLGLGWVYTHALHGYSADVPAAALDALRADPRVAYVERDGVMRADTTQTGATWGIDRI